MDGIVSTEPLLLPQCAPAQWLQAQPSGLAALFHALGGPALWFRARAWPQALRWAACAIRPVRVDAQLPLCLPDYLQAACAAASQWRPVSADGALAASLHGLPSGPAQRGLAPHDATAWEARLQAADRAVRALIWAALQRAEVRDRDGQRWYPAAGSLWAWQAAQPAPHVLCLRAACWAEHPWQRCIAHLHAQGIWQADHRAGRWVALEPGWAVLWPLAGRDLREAARQCLGYAPDLDRILEGLQRWNCLPAPDTVPLAWTRPDGRRLEVLPMAAHLHPGGGSAVPSPRHPVGRVSPC